MTAEFEDDMLVLKGKSVKQNKSNRHEIKRYTHKIKIEDNYEKHAMTAKTDNLNFTLTIPKKDPIYIKSKNKGVLYKHLIILLNKIVLDENENTGL